uniref:Lipocalin/cytosolic fatty-acid binding domain-containing protein n=1 Tax=Equus asinus asinus TaxID=83772 RepID=A0A8C4MHS2_EQUAS
MSEPESRRRWNSPGEIHGQRKGFQPSVRDHCGESPGCAGCRSSSRRVLGKRSPRVVQAAAQHPPPARGENPPLISSPVLVPPPDLDEDTVFALDTDYKNYLFLCMKNAATPGQSLVCQYLARTQMVDEEIMEKFRRALQPLPGRVQIIPDLTRMAERCRI